MGDAVRRIERLEGRRPGACALSADVFARAGRGCACVTCGGVRATFGDPEARRAAVERARAFERRLGLCEA